MQSETILRNARSFEADIRVLLSNHLTLYQVARELKITPATLRRYMEHLGITPPRNRKQRSNPEDFRLPKMIAMRKEGMTLDEIGTYFGLTRERVRQLLEKDCPDTVFPKRLSPRSVCEHCQIEYAASQLRPRFCSAVCKKANRASAFTRDKALLIMACRDRGCSWGEVSKELHYGGSYPSFRASLQRFKHFFSTEEQRKYFPAKDQNRFKPSGVKLLPTCSQTGEHQESFIIRRLRSLFSLLVP